ncbi:MAG: ATP-binding cassette domain-containing protein [Dehalococcoidia bacterium]|nr:ATP-binding cassette domain-containing protein [Dehalococcoidia bacterium]
MQDTTIAIECKDLGRKYETRGRKDKKETTALQGLNLTVRRGSVFGLLGPNGAGKTTTVRILATLLTPSSGSAAVMGFDVDKQANEVRRRIGLVLGGERGLYRSLTGRENLRYFAALNDIAPKLARVHIDELLEAVGLNDAGDTRVEEYSRGMRQRLHIARGLLNDPDIILLDEPTIGLDPIGALELRQMIPELASQGKTIFLTTHYMLEADLLCETVCLINHGAVVAMGSPTEIKQRFSKTRIIEVTCTDLSPVSEKLRVIPQVGRVESRIDGVFQKLTLHIEEGAIIQKEIAECLGEGVIESMVEREPNLEEAYISILGRN